MTREYVENLFRYKHLPERLQTVSKIFHKAAMDTYDAIPSSAEQTLAIRKLWEAKNLAVYAAVDAE